MTAIATNNLPTKSARFAVNVLRAALTVDRHKAKELSRRRSAIYFNKKRAGGVPFNRDGKPGSVRYWQERVRTDKIVRGDNARRAQAAMATGIIVLLTTAVLAHHMPNDMIKDVTRFLGAAYCVAVMIIAPARAVSFDLTHSDMRGITERNLLRAQNREKQQLG